MQHTNSNKMMKTYSLLDLHIHAKRKPTETLARNIVSSLEHVTSSMLWPRCS